ncbi:MAG: hypothetical protein V2I46_02710 [Bacteroides sp.]|jgi:hypothetical protein|nr:hypothetical protein [Bacteroides sp.]
MKTRIYFLFLMLCIGWLLTGCPADKCPEGEKAVLRDYAGLDGCRWLFELEDGQRLEPVNLHQYDVELQDGLKVTITYTEATDMMSICMAGKMVNITCISKR